jgi:hypothetical protein
MDRRTLVVREYWRAMVSFACIMQDLAVKVFHFESDLGHGCRLKSVAEQAASRASI